jgi:hypothetical protein
MGMHQLEQQQAQKKKKKKNLKKARVKIIRNGVFTTPCFNVKATSSS